MGSFASGFKEGLNNIGGWFTDLGSGIADGFTTITGNIKGFFTDLGSTISSGFSSLLDGILDGLKTLFIPSSSPFTEIRDLFYSKFPIINDIELAVQSSLALFEQTKEPTFSIHFTGQYGLSGEIVTLNLKPYEPYRDAVKMIITAVAWLWTVIFVIKFIPKLLGGIP